MGNEDLLTIAAFMWLHGGMSKEDVLDLPVRDIAMYSQMIEKYEEWYFETHKNATVAAIGEWWREIT